MRLVDSSYLQYSATASDTINPSIYSVSSSMMPTPENAKEVHIADIVN